MEDSFKVKKVTYNAITFEWLFKKISSTSPFRSRPCTLISDTYPVCFTILIYPGMNPEFRIQTSRNGRAIIKLVIDEDKPLKRSGLVFMNHWQYGFRRNLPIALTDKESTLIIRCSITWLGCLDDQNIEPYHLAPLLRPIMPFDNTQSPDFQININSRQLSAHKAILAYHSAVLAAMFQIPMKESIENEMTVTDIEYSTMEVVLNIMYGGQTDDLNDMEVALNVLMVGEKYQMPIVKSTAEHKLLFAINDNNVLRLLDEADKHNAFHLCHTCVEYIIAKGDDILGLDEVKRMADTKLFIKAAVGELGFELIRLFSIDDGI